MTNVNSVITQIQSSIKKALGIKNTPDLASSKNIKSIAQTLAIDLSDATFQEKQEIVTHLVTVLEKQNSQLTNIGDSQMINQKDNQVFGANNSAPPESNETALTFDNNFSKAGLVKVELSQVGIQVQDVQALKVAENLGNSFSNKSELLLEALAIYQQLFDKNSSLIASQIENKLNAIRDMEQNHNAEIMGKLHEHAITMNAYRESFDSQFENMVCAALGVDKSEVKKRMLNNG